MVCSVELIVEGNSTLTASGRNNITMERVSWDVSPYKGKTARIEVIDNSSESWGYVSFDDVRFDAPPRPVEDAHTNQIEIAKGANVSLAIQPL